MPCRPVLSSSADTGVLFFSLNGDGKFAEPDDFPDNDAGTVWDRDNIGGGLEPDGLPTPLYLAAAAGELADRVQARNWDTNLDGVLYPDAPWTAPGRPMATGPIRGPHVFLAKLPDLYAEPGTPRRALSCVAWRNLLISPAQSGAGPRRDAHSA